MQNRPSPLVSKKGTAIWKLPLLSLKLLKLVGSETVARMPPTRVAVNAFFYIYTIVDVQVQEGCSELRESLPFVRGKVVRFTLV